MYLFDKPSISNSSTESHCVFKIFCDNVASQFNPTHANASFLYPLKTIKWLYQTLKILSKNLPWWLIQSIDGSNDSFYFAVNDNTLNFRQILTVLSAHETGCIKIGKATIEGCESVGKYSVKRPWCNPFLSCELYLEPI